MSKKILVGIVLLVFILAFSAVFAEEVSVTIPEFDVNVNGEVIDTKHSQYPVISYNGVVYFPMTYDYLKGTGLDLKFSTSEGLKINAISIVTAFKQSFLGASNELGSRQNAEVANFVIEVNGKAINNSNEEYPVLFFKNITYFPMTWRFAVEEFGWRTKWSNETGFGITTGKSGSVVVSETNNKRPVATIEFENGSKVVIELLPEIAPNTVNNYISLIKKGYYDGLTFHRVIPGFMIQGGDPNGNGSGGPGYSIKDEFTIQDGIYRKYLSHTRGVISMAKTQSADSAGSQFFIMQQDGSFLDTKYASFGRVVEGIEVVDEVTDTETDASDKPVVDVVIKSITVELNGYEFKEPETIK